MIPHDDPRLTRYALNEMTDVERVAFERELTDADRAEVAAIRALAGTLTNELKAESAPALATPTARRDRPATRRVLAIAASIAVVGLFGAALLTSKRNPDVAIHRTPDARPSTQPATSDAASGPAVSAEFSIISEIDPGFMSGDVDQPRSRELRRLDESAFASARPARPVREPLKEHSIDVWAARMPAPGEQKGVPAGKQIAETARPSAGGDGNSSTIADVQNQARAGQGQAPADARAAGGGGGPGGFGGFGGPGGGARLFGIADRENYRYRSIHDLDVQALADRSGREAPSADSYARIVENRFIAPIGDAAVSTFGVDVDTASYANVRRFLQNNQRPPANAVRIEELINYFPTGDAPPTDGRPFAMYADVASCPWNASHQLVRVALKAREVAVAHRPPSNLVFLVDVSGSMSDADKLPLVKRGLQRLIDSLNEDDRVAIVVYAGNSGLVLPSTNAANKDVIRAAIDKLEAGGATNGGQGIELAYATAVANFRAGGANRVILCTDGDFNVGVTDRGALVEMIQQKAKAGVFLSVFGFGRGNLKDDTMESLADKGNGQYAYVDSDREAHKVFVEQASGTLVTVAKDVKVQVEFNPATVKSYRLIGYENRALKTEDFNNDLKDAGEIGAGHNVVALYEIEPNRSGDLSRHSDGALKYQTTSAPAIAPDANKTELLTLKLRFKAPDAPLEQGVSELIERTLDVSDRTIEDAAPDFQFAAAVAGFGMMLRESPNRGELDWATVARLARAGVGKDAGGYRAEFIGLVDRAATLAPRPVTPAPAR